MKTIITIAALVLAASTMPVTAQTRADLRGPTGQQRVKLPPGVEGATGGGARPRARCRVVIRRGHRTRTCRPARG